MIIPKWFQQSITAACIVLVSLMIFIAGGSMNSNLRRFDANIGLIKIEMTENLNWRINRYLTGIKVNAQQPVVVVNNPLIEFSPAGLLQVLSKVAKEAAASLIQSFIGLVMNKFEELINAFEAQSSAVDGLRDAFANFVQGVVIWTNQQFESTFGPTSEEIAFGLLNVSPQEQANLNPTARNALSGAVSGLLVNEVLNKVSQRAGDPVVVQSRGELEQNKKDVASTVAAAVCQFRAGPELILPEIWNVSENQCVRDKALSTVQAINQNAQPRIEAAQRIIDQTNAQSGGCGVGVLQSAGAASAASVLTILNQNQVQSVSNGVSTSSFGAGLAAAANGINPEPLSPRECSDYQNGSREASLAAAGVATTTGNSEFNVDGIVNVFRKAIQGLFDRLIQNITQKIIGIISNFLNSIPAGGFLGNAIQGLTSQLTSYLGQAMNVLRSQIGNLKIL